MDQLLNQEVPHAPTGLHFVPTDEELLIDLKKKINDEPTSYEFIPNINVYKNNPKELTEAYPSLGKNGWYFYTTRDRKYLNGNRPNRTTGNGYWKASAAEKRMYDHNNFYIGSKRSLVFYEGKSPKHKKTNWLMQEYMINQSSKQHRGTNDMLLDKCVLCRIYMNSRRYKKVEEDAAIISSQIEEQENNNTPSLPGQQQQQNFPTIQYSHWPTDQIGGPLPYSFGSTSYNTGQIYNIENLENAFLVDPKPDASLNYHRFGDYNDHPLHENVDNFTPCTLMDSFGPSAYDMDDLWEELSNEKNQFTGRKV